MFCESNNSHPRIIDINVFGKIKKKYCAFQKIVFHININVIHNIQYYFKGIVHP